MQKPDVHWTEVFAIWTDVKRGSTVVTYNKSTQQAQQQNCMGKATDVYMLNMDLVINVTHLCQQGKALTTFLSTKVTLWHYIIVLVEFLHGELQAVDILDEQQNERVEHQDGRAIEDRFPWIEVGN